ncbi:MAG: hypothetical protein ACKVLA_17400, partial [Rhodobacterales bacterium]
NTHYERLTLSAFIVSVTSAWHRETEIYQIGERQPRTYAVLGEFGYRVAYKDGVLAVGAFGLGRMDVYTRTTQVRVVFPKSNDCVPIQD